MLIFGIDLFRRGGTGIAGDDTAHSELVRESQQARMDAAGLGLRSGLVGVVSHDGRSRLADLAGTEGSPKRGGSLGLFALQLFLNSLWSVLFFGLQQPGTAAVEIILLWIAILLILIAFWQKSRWAGSLLVPYLLWGQFRCRSEFRNLEFESMSARCMDADTRSNSVASAISQISHSWDFDVASKV